MTSPKPLAFSPIHAGMLAPPLRTFLTPESAQDFGRWLASAMREINDAIAKSHPSSLINTNDPGYHCTLYGMERPLTDEELQALCEPYTRVGWPRVVASNASVAPEVRFVCFQLFMTP